MKRSMENEAQVFSSEEFGQIRTVTIDGEPWFVGKDVAAALGYENTRDALYKHVDSEDKNTVAIRDGIQGNPNMTIINESGLYALIFGSKLELAKKFKRWVTSEVLPSIRKTGTYGGSEGRVLQRFMEQQMEFNQRIRERLESMEHGRTETWDNPYCDVDERYIESRKKEIYTLTSKVAELCGKSHTKVLYYMYRALERYMGIVLNSYKSVYRSETGRWDASMVEVIAANDKIYKTAIEMNQTVIERKRTFG